MHDRIKKPGICLVREHTLGLLGTHQVENAAVALAVLALLGIGILLGVRAGLSAILTGMMGA